MEYKLNMGIDVFSGTYAFNDWWLALAKVPNKGKVVKTLTSIHSCRESLCLDTARALGANLGGRYSYGRIGQLSVNDRKHINLVILSKVCRNADIHGPLTKGQITLTKSKEESIKKAG